MNRETILKELLSHQAELTSRFGVESVSLFGSVARNEAIATSDLDMLVTFIHTPGIFAFLDLKEYLESLFKCRVDLVTKNALKKPLRQQILQEAIHAF
jgi:uncharacterized protein